MQLHDTYNVTDSLVRGYVIMKDQNNNVIFQKSNMIVASGRDAIFNTILKSAIAAGMGEQQQDIGQTFSHFSRIRFGNGTSITTPETTSIKEILDASDEKKNIIYDIPLVSTTVTDVKLQGSSVNISNDIDNNIRHILFEITVPAEQPAEITELGLFFRTTETNGDSVSDNGGNAKIHSNEKLFSRVVFDPIYCGANAAITELKLNYYLYF